MDSWQKDVANGKKWHNFADVGQISHGSTVWFECNAIHSHTCETQELRLKYTDNVTESRSRDGMMGAVSSFRKLKKWFTSLRWCTCFKATRLKR